MVQLFLSFVSICDNRMVFESGIGRGIRHVDAKFLGGTELISVWWGRAVQSLFRLGDVPNHFGFRLTRNAK